MMPAMNGNGPRGMGHGRRNEGRNGWCGQGRGLGFCRLAELDDRQTLTEAKNCLQARIDQIDRRLNELEQP